MERDTFGERQVRVYPSAHGGNDYAGDELCVAVPLVTAGVESREAEVGTGKSFQGPTGLQRYSLRDMMKVQGPAVTLDKTKADGVSWEQLPPPQTEGLARGGVREIGGAAVNNGKVFRVTRGSSRTVDHKEIKLLFGSDVQFVRQAFLPDSRAGQALSQARIPDVRPITVGLPSQPVVEMRDQPRPFGEERFLGKLHGFVEPGGHTAALLGIKRHDERSCLGIMRI
jgi:hypothetical protein